MTSTLSATTRRTTSADGTEIAYEVHGSGPALVLVDGAMCQRSMGPARGLAGQLATTSPSTPTTDEAAGQRPRHLAVRGRPGGRGPLAVINAAGGPAHVFGASSGATLALEAARQGAPIGRLAVYESPFIVDGTRPANDPRLPEIVSDMVTRGRRAEAVTTFLRTVGLPTPVSC